MSTIQSLSGRKGAFGSHSVGEYGSRKSPVPSKQTSPFFFFFFFFFLFGNSTTLRGIWRISCSPSAPALPAVDHHRSLMIEVAPPHSPPDGPSPGMMHQAAERGLRRSYLDSPTWEQRNVRPCLLAKGCPNHGSPPPHRLGLPSQTTTAARIPASMLALARLAGTCQKNSFHDPKPARLHFRSSYHRIPRAMPPLAPDLQPLSRQAAQTRTDGLIQVGEGEIVLLLTSPDPAPVRVGWGKRGILSDGLIKVGEGRSWSFFAVHEPPRLP